MNIKDIKVENNTDELRVVGILSKGFGLNPKLVMQDLRLSIEAKAIYNYFSSYAGNGNTAFPKVITIIYHLQISESRYYRHFKQLVDYGYISVNQIKEKGKYSHNIYTLNQIIDTTKGLSPSTQNEGTENEGTENEGTQNEGTQNEGTNINSSNKNNIDINNSEYNQSINQSKVKDKSESSMIEGRTEEDLNLYFQNMEIDKLNTDIEDIQALKDAITYMYFATDLKIGKAIFPASIIKSKISKLNSMHLEYVLQCFKESSKQRKIVNPLMYLCSSLFNAVSNNTLDFQAKVNFDDNN